MDTIVQVWNIIVHSNTFNFVVMLCLLAFIVRKFDIGGALNKSVADVSILIEKSTDEKVIAENNLKQTKENVKNLEYEVQNKMETAKEHVNTLSHSVSSATELKVSKIQQNLEKSILSEEKKISSSMLADVAKNSIESAKSKILSELSANPLLHEKYIDESLEQIDRMTL